MKKNVVFLFFLYSFVGIFAQNEVGVVVAEQGDGIFSILRKQGLDPVKHYGEFLKLNREILKEGDELVLGREYLVPVTDRSFKNMAVVLDNKAKRGRQSSLFDKELESISPKSERLKNAVIYLMAASETSQPNAAVRKLKQGMLVSLAQELMVHGAKVYLLKNKEEVDDMGGQPVEIAENNVEAPMANLSEMRHYVELVNKKYLKNIGKYQRLLVINFNETVAESSYYRVSVYHDKNPDGERFAKNIQHTLNKYSAVEGSKDYTEVFGQKNNLYLANNAMPPVTLIDIGDSKNPSVEERISVRPDKDWLTNIIANGIINDYANLDLSK